MLCRTASGSTYCLLLMTAPERFRQPLLTSRCLARELDTVIRQHGKPEMIVSDNGTEMTSHAVLVWCQDTGIELHHVALGKPIQNAFMESFNVRLRNECLMKVSKPT